MMIATSHGKRTESCGGHVRVRDRDDGAFSFQDGRIRREATRPQQVSRWSLPLLSPDTLFNSRLANVLGAIVVLVISALAVLQLARVLGLAG